MEKKSSFREGAICKIYPESEENEILCKIKKIIEADMSMVLKIIQIRTIKRVIGISALTNPITITEGKTYHITNTDNGWEFTINNNGAVNN